MLILKEALSIRPCLSVAKQAGLWLVEVESDSLFRVNFFHSKIIITLDIIHKWEW